MTYVKRPFSFNIVQINIFMVYLINNYAEMRNNMKSTKKKLIMFVSAVALLAAAMFAFTACGQKSFRRMERLMISLITI